MSQKQFINLLIEISERLADESDYEDYLLPQLQNAVDYLEELQ
jgi:hypothetical protein